MKDSSKDIIKLDSQGLQQYLTNRYPYLMIDRAIEVVPGVSAQGYKNLTSDEWFFPVHFPEEPIMPGMIQMEALLQMLSLTVLTMDGQKGKVVSGISADRIVLKRKVIPGDRLDIQAELMSFDHGEAIGNAVGKVDGRLACSATFRFSLSVHANNIEGGD